MPAQPDPALAPDTPPSRRPLPFDQHLRESWQNLRAALSDLFTSVGLDPTRPRELARRLSVNKNVVWRASKIITAHDEAAAVHHVPGSAALGALLAALSKAGASGDAIARVRDAVAAYDEMVATHTGDRATLEQVTAVMNRDPRMLERLEQSRKQAFMGLAATWGVQAELQLSTFVVAPSRDDPGMLDLVRIAGLRGFRRMRPDARWLLHKHYVRSDLGTELTSTVAEPLDLARGTGTLPLVGGFCSDELPEFESERRGSEMRYVLPAGPVGNTAAFTCTFGLVYRGVLPATRTPSEVTAEFASPCSTPVERVQFDLIVSDELPWLQDPRPSLYHRLNGDGVTAADPREDNRVPLLESVQDLGSGHSAMASPHAPRYTELLERVFERAGWDSAGFRGFRFSMRYPPIPTSLLLCAELPGPA